MLTTVNRFCCGFVQNGSAGFSENMLALGFKSENNIPSNGVA